MSSFAYTATAAAPKGPKNWDDPEEFLENGQGGPRGEEGPGGNPWDGSWDPLPEFWDGSWV